MATITQATIEAYLSARSRPASGQRRLTIGGGLDLVIAATGPGRWGYRYRARGVDPETNRRYPQRSITAGTTATHSLREAAAVAAVLRLRVNKGEDPALADRDAVVANRAAAVASRRKAQLDEAARVTCRTKLDEYRTVLAARGRSAKHQREELAQVRLALVSTNLMEVTPADLTAAHVDGMLLACPPGSRALRFGAVDRFLRWAGRGAGVAPATASLDRHERPSTPAPPQRVLSAAEVAAIWTAVTTPIGKMSRTPRLRPLLALLISTPCREGEAASATWADIDLPGRVWTQPTSKNSRPHRFPLNDRAFAILHAQRTAAGDNVKQSDLVFPSPRAGVVFAGWSNLKLWLDK